MKQTIYPKISETVFTQTLENGLTVIITAKKGYAKSYAHFAANYGSVDTKFLLNGQWLGSPDGVAHFLEHKMFDMEQGNALQILASGGASPNAYTSYDVTAYHFECTENFYENLKTLLTFVSVPYFTQESVDKEQGIIAQEIRMYEDSPNSQVLNKLFEIMYQSHPVRVSIAGTVDSIARITAQTLYDCHKAFYHPSNMVLCVVGDVEPQKVVELADSILPKGRAEAIGRDYGLESEKPHLGKSSIQMEVGNPLFAIGFKGSASVLGNESVKSEILGDLTAEYLMGQSSPLYAELYEKGLINSSFSGGYDSFSGISLMLASGESREPEAVYEAILEQAGHILRQGMNKSLFSRLKKSYYGKRVRELNSFETLCYRQAKSFFAGTDYMKFTDVFDSITPEASFEFISRCITREKSAISIVAPNL